MTLDRRTLLARAGWTGLVAGLALSARPALAQEGAFTATIPITGEDGVNLRVLADAAGYNGVQAANIAFELSENVALVGAAGVPDGGCAIDTGEWPSSSYAIALSLSISGKVYGGGGKGGHGSGVSPYGGGAGGDALVCREAITITVEPSGEIRGGGGGGGGGGGWTLSDDGVACTALQGGGGGGGFPNGPGGFGVHAGEVGSASAGGASGDGGLASERGSGAGGVGASPGQVGASGENASGQTDASHQICPPGTGGAAGCAVCKNGHQVSIIYNGGSITGIVG